MHQFGTRQELLTALAIEGFRGLNEALSRHGDDIHEMGAVYVLWALSHPGRYAAMWQSRGLDEARTELTGVREHAWNLLASAGGPGLGNGPDPQRRGGGRHFAVRR